MASRLASTIAHRECHGARFYIKEAAETDSFFPSTSLLGPAFAPIIGGLLTNAGAAPGEKGTSGWRLTFIFIAACGAASFISYCFFRETFRTERSIPWQNAKRAAVERARKRPAHNKTVDAAVTLGSHDKSDSFASRLRGYLQRVLRSARPVIRTSEREQAAQITAEGAAPKYMEPGSEASNGRERGPRSEKEWNTLARKPTTRHSISRTVVEQGEAIKVCARVVPCFAVIIELSEQLVCDITLTHQLGASSVPVCQMCLLWAQRSPSSSSRTTSLR